MFYSTGPIFFGAVFTAAIWDYFFIPPHGTLSILNVEDIVIIMSFFVASVCMGILAFRIRQREQQLQAKLISERLYQVMFDSVSHELKTPLTAIIGSATVLEQEQKKFGSAHALTCQIAESAYRISLTIDNLLDFLRLNSGRLQLKKEWQDCEDFIKANLEQSQHVLTGHQIQLNVSDSLPLINIDFSFLSHAFVNLLFNAVRYSPAGSAIQIAAEQSDKNIIFSVSDCGPGIPSEHLVTIFQKFFRVPGSASGGLGLGLAIAKEIVEMHSGSVWAENCVGSGASFFMRLPVEPQPSFPSLGEA